MKFPNNIQTRLYPNNMQKILTMILLLCCNYIVVAQSLSGDRKIVGYVNGEPVTKDEFTFFAQRNRHKVISKFRNEYKLNYHTGFWQDKSKGKTPGELLKEMTIESIVSSKVQYQLAKQYGIINDISFQSIRQYMESENKQRREALQKNIVLYGPEQYSLESYYEYLTSNMIIKLKDYMLKNDIIMVDFSQGVQRENNSTMHDDDKYYSKVHVANTQINHQYDEIIKQIIEKAKVKFDKHAD